MKICHFIFHIKKSKKKYEELLINSILYLNNPTRNLQVKNCSLVDMEKTITSRQYEHF